MFGLVVAGGVGSSAGLVVFAVLEVGCSSSCSVVCLARGTAPGGTGGVVVCFGVDATGVTTGLDVLALVLVLVLGAEEVLLPVALLVVDLAVRKPAPKSLFFSFLVSPAGGAAGCFLTGPSSNGDLGEGAPIS